MASGKTYADMNDGPYNEYAEPHIHALELKKRRVSKSLIALVEENERKTTSMNNSNDFISVAGDMPHRPSIFHRRNTSDLTFIMHQRRQTRQNSIFEATENTLDEQENVSFNMRTFVSVVKAEIWASEDGQKKSRVTEAWSWLRERPWFNVWKADLKEIEGKYGGAVMSYFSFVKLLVMLNVLICACMLPIVVPHYILRNPGDNQNETSCIQTYRTEVNKEISGMEWYDYPVQIITGEGFVEKEIFYGAFDPRYELPVNDPAEFYNMSLAFMAVLLSCFLFSLIVIMYRTSTYLPAAMTTAGLKLPQKYTMYVLSAWDYSLTDQQGCDLQKSFIRSRLLVFMERDAQARETKRRTTAERNIILIQRILSHSAAVLLVGIFGYAVFNAQIISDDQRLRMSRKNSTDVTAVAEELFWSFLPSLTITALYAIVPIMFGIIVRFESYSTEMQIVVTMMRTAGLRLATLALIFFPFFINSLTCVKKDCGNCKDSSTAQTGCWETYIGQQLYKLVIMDFVMALFTVFLFECPRQLIYKELKDKISLVAQMGKQEFNIPKLALDIGYTQTLCWLSILFCPFIPVVTLLKTIMLFYIRKFSLWRNQQPSPEFSLASEVRVYFLMMLVVYLIISFTIVGICIEFLTPSQSCGPFRGEHPPDWNQLHSMLDAVLLAVPEVVQTVLNFTSTLAFLLIVIVILSLLLSGNIAVAQGSDRLFDMLEESNERILKDNRVLWDRINSISKSLADEDGARSTSAVPARRDNRGNSQIRLRTYPQQNTDDIFQESRGQNFDNAATRSSKLNVSLITTSSDIETTLSQNRSPARNPI